MIYHNSVIHRIITVGSNAQKLVKAYVLHFAQLLCYLHSEISVIVASVQIFRLDTETLAYLAQAVFLALRHKMSVQYLRIKRLERKVRLFISVAFGYEKIDVVDYGMSENYAFFVLKKFFDERIKIIEFGRF